MTRSPTRIRLAAIALLAAAQPAAAIETIDCTRDHNPAERTICGSQRLQILDAKIVEVYAELMSSRQLSAARKADLKQSQRNFLVRRDACGANYDCLEDVMGMRSTRIHYYR
jgi:uncharacterized protein